MSMASWVWFSASGSSLEAAASCFQGESSEMWAGNRLACWSTDQNRPYKSNQIQLKSNRVNLRKKSEMCIETNLLFSSSFSRDVHPSQWISLQNDNSNTMRVTINIAYAVSCFCNKLHLQSLIVRKRGYTVTTMKLGYNERGYNKHSVETSRIFSAMISLLPKSTQL